MYVQCLQSAKQKKKIFIYNSKCIQIISWAIQRCDKIGRKVYFDARNHGFHSMESQ